MKMKFFWIVSITTMIVVGVVFQFIMHLDYIKNQYVGDETESLTPLIDTNELDLITDEQNVYERYEFRDEQIYDSFLDFPYNDMRFACYSTFLFIKGAYDKIDFYSEFCQGDLNVYDYYKSKYKQLLMNEVTFTDNKTGEALYFKEYSPFSHYSEDVNDYVFYFFDIDEDGAPELGISNYLQFNYIFKYDNDSDEMFLWCDEMDVSWYQLMGSKTIQWNRKGIRHAFYKLDDCGNIECFVFFPQ